jgi:tRNA(Glu) U13 pseudouridine synthase TruD
LTDLLAPRPVPLLTPDLPGTSGLLRVTEEDFSVEELPLYEPSGAGEHLYLTVEKRGRSGRASATSAPPGSRTGGR